MGLERSRKGLGVRASDRSVAGLEWVLMSHKIPHKISRYFDRCDRRDVSAAAGETFECWSLSHRSCSRVEAIYLCSHGGRHTSTRLSD
jgi:hypothetical protein